VLRISLIYSVSVAVRCVNKIILFFIYFFLFLFFYICDFALGVHYCTEVGFPIFVKKSLRGIRKRRLFRRNPACLAEQESLGIPMGSVAMSYMRKGFLIYEEMRKYLTIYKEAGSHK
jgi:hypothetical protein